MEQAMSQRERRSSMLQSHLHPGHSEESGDGTCLSQNPTAGEFLQNDLYSVVLPEKLSDNKWNVHRSALSPLKLVDSFPEANIKTVHDNFEYAVSEYGKNMFLGTRLRPNGTVGDFQWVSYFEAGEERTAVGSGLMQAGLKKGSSVGLYLLNRPEWVITDLACFAYGFVSVPLYDTLGPEAVRYICNHAELEAVVCSRDKLQTIMDCLQHCPSVKLVVVVGGGEHLLLPSTPPNSGVTYIAYSKLEAQGRVSPHPFSPLPPLDTVSICYTSGTTGLPKGAMLTHRSMVASAAGACFGAIMQKGDVHLSYLPLAHIYERLNVQMLIHFGAAIGFYQGDVLKIMDDLECLRPTIFCSVPRLYNRIYDKVMNAVKQSGGLQEYLFNVAFNAKKQAMAKGRTPSPVWDRLVFNKIKSRLGGRVRIMVTGASPISQEVFDFLKICFGCRVIEGYGMTETTCTITTMDEFDTTSGHVGSPTPACEVKLADVPEMEYLSSDRPNPRGEICVRGPTLFRGYFKDEQQTKDLIDSDGWLHTGDVGMWLEGGRLKIIDRKKSIFKLAQGEYIAPEKIENVYQQSPFIAQIFVHGDSLNSALVAIVCVDPEMMVSWAKSRPLPNADDVAGLCQNLAVRAAVIADMDKIGGEAKLRGFEFVKAVHLTAEPFTLESGLLTPTFKIKRPQAKQFFTTQIDELYAGLKQKETETMRKSKL